MIYLEQRFPDHCTSGAGIFLGGHSFKNVGIADYIEVFETTKFVKTCVFEVQLSIVLGRYRGTLLTWTNHIWRV